VANLVISCLLSINLLALIALLLHLLGLRLVPADPFALAGGGMAYHPQLLVELQRLVNSRRSVAYWSGVRHG